MTKYGNNTRGVHVALLLIIFILRNNIGIAQDYNIRLSDGLDYTQGIEITELYEGYLAVEWGYSVASNLKDEYNYCLFDKITSKKLDCALSFFPNKGLYKSGLSKGLKSLDEKSYYHINETFCDSIIQLINLEIKDNKVVKTAVDSFYIPNRTNYYGSVEQLFHYKGHLYGLFNVYDANEKKKYYYAASVLSNFIDTLFFHKLDHQYSHVNNLLVLPNNNLLVSGFQISNNFIVFIDEIDASGKIISKQYINDKEDYAISSGRAISISNDQYLIFAEKVTWYSSFSYYKSPALFLYDHKKKKNLWKKDFPLTNAPAFNRGFEAMAPSVEQGHYLYAGIEPEYFEETDSVVTYGMIGKIDLTGEVIWQRRYTATPAGKKAYHEFFDIINTSDGNYVAVGNSHYGRYPGDTASWYNGWLIKINDHGDIVPIDTTSTAIDVEGDLQHQIRIYPNPVSDMLHINQDDISGVTYSIIDMQGRMVDELRLTSPNLSTTWDVGHLHSGQYVIQITSKDGKYSTYKMIKR